MKDALKLPPLGAERELQQLEQERKKSGDKRLHKPEKGVYKCKQCERTYLSYPALYTHCKIKHPIARSAKGLAKPSNRGRPRKTVSPVLTLADSRGRQAVALRISLQAGRTHGRTDVCAERVCKSL